MALIYVWCENQGPQGHTDRYFNKHLMLIDIRRDPEVLSTFDLSRIFINQLYQDCMEGTSSVEMKIFHTSSFKVFSQS